MRTYRGIDIEWKHSGWWVAFIPGRGYLKANTLGGIKELIRDTLAK